MGYTLARFPTTSGSASSEITRVTFKPHVTEVNNQKLFRPQNKMEEAHCRSGPKRLPLGLRRQKADTNDPAVISPIHQGDRMQRLLQHPSANMVARWQIWYMVLYSSLLSSCFRATAISEKRSRRVRFRPSQDRQVPHASWHRVKETAQLPALSASCFFLLTRRLGRTNTRELLHGQRAKYGGTCCSTGTRFAFSCEAHHASTKQLVVLGKGILQGCLTSGLKEGAS